MINLQRADGKAKAYQVRQVRAMLRTYSQLLEIRGTLKSHRYEVIVSWYPDDELFVAEVPELPGCIAHGATPAAAVTSAQEAISLWLDVARENGDPIPRPRVRRSMPA